MSATLNATARRNAQIDAVIEARLTSDEEALAAIEVVPDDGGQRDEDLRLVREALDGGASPRSLGAVFVAVVTNFAYEVDWKDQFCFWPKMHDYLRSTGLNLHDHAARRSVASAFERFSRARRGVTPVGELAEHFPLMAWPLIHAVMPWCAQRHVARVLERAATDGLIPDDPTSPWPEGRVEALAASMRLPVFVVGIIESPSVLARVGRVLLGDTQRAEVPAWVRRLRRSVDHDAVTRSLVAGANETRRERARGKGSRTPGLAVSLLLQAEGSAGEALRLLTSIGPYGRVIGASSEVLAFARAGAALVARVNGADARGVPLFNALAAPALAEVIWKGATLRVQPAARPFEGSDVPDVLKRAETDSAREFTAPLVFRREDEGRYALVAGSVSVGDRIAVLAVHASALSDALKARGFAPTRVRGAEQFTALVGVASEAIAGELSAGQVTVDARGPTLEPALIPALRRDGERLVFRSGRDVWLRLVDAPVGVVLRAEVVRAGEVQAVEVGEGESGDILVHVPSGMLSVGLQSVRVFAEGRTRSIANIEALIESPSQESGLTRWRVALHPADASLEHLREKQCWLEVESIPGVRVEVELRCRGRVCSTTLEPDERGALLTARRLQGLSSQIFASDAQVIEQVDLRARACDEPESWLTVATLGASDASLRFDLSSKLPSVVAPDDAPSLVRLEFRPDGLGYQAATFESLREAGLYLATVGASRAALCVCEDLRRVPRPSRARRFARSIERSLELLSTLRAVDVAAVWPEASLSSGVLMRRASARVIERELVGSLCGRAWVDIEDAIDAGERDLDALSKQMSSLLWVDEPWLRERIEDVEDPLELLRELLERIEERPDAPEARHLTLSFYQRGMTTRRLDEAAVRWAWASVRRARAARACYLVDPDALVDAIDNGRADDDA